MAHSSREESSSSCELCFVQEGLDDHSNIFDRAKGVLLQIENTKGLNIR